MKLPLSTALSALLGIVKGVYSLDLSIYDVNPIEHVIDAVDCFHVEDSCNVVPLDNVLLQLDAFDHRKNTR